MDLKLFRKDFQELPKLQKYLRVWMQPRHHQARDVVARTLYGFRISVLFGFGVHTTQESDKHSGPIVYLSIAIILGIMG